MHRSWLHLPEFLSWKPAGQIIYIKICYSNNWDIKYQRIIWCCSIALSVIAIQDRWLPLVLQDCMSDSVLSQIIGSLHPWLVFAVLFSWRFVFFFSTFSFFSISLLFLALFETVSFPVLLTRDHFQQVLSAIYDVTGEVLQLASQFKYFYKCKYRN